MHAHPMLHARLTCAGWQDTGSAVRVRASSALQPDLESVFEAEQVCAALAWCCSRSRSRSLPALPLQWLLLLWVRPRPQELQKRAPSASTPASTHTCARPQVVLAPGDWAPDCLHLFGLSTNVQVRTGLCAYMLRLRLLHG